MEKHVLIVDDQRGIRFLLEEIIKSEGYRVQSCENGIEAIDQVEREIPDLLIIDYQLPFKNGLAVVETLEEKGYVIPTILMSGLIDELKIKGKAFKSIKAYFSKPFDILKAKDQINQLLDS